SRGRESPAELFHTLGRGHGERRSVCGSCLGDRDGAMRSDASKDERHRASMDAYNCSEAGPSRNARGPVVSHVVEQARDAAPWARSSTVEQGTFNPLVPGSNPGGLTATTRLGLRGSCKEPLHPQGIASRSRVPSRWRCTLEAWPPSRRGSRGRSRGRRLPATGPEDASASTVSDGAARV